MGDINDDEVPCCSKDVKREDDCLLQKFVPVHVYSESSLRRMMSQDVSSRRVTTHECGLCGFHAPSRTMLLKSIRTEYSYTKRLPNQGLLTCNKGEGLRGV